MNIGYIVVPRVPWILLVALVPWGDYTLLVFDPKMLDDIAERFSSVIPKGISTMGADVKSKCRVILEQALSELDLVTRSEFDVQKKVLLRTREKLEALEKIVNSLEKPPKT